MPGNAFIKFEETIPLGESTHDSHSGKKGWIEISDWGWEISADTSFLKGAGASVGKPQPGELNFSHYYDVSSPVIMMKIVQGKHFPKVHIVMLKQTGDESGKGEPYFGITVQEAFITKVTSKGGEDGAVTQDVDMVFKTVAIAYSAQKLEGGGLDVAKDFIWDIGQMKTEGVPKMNLSVK